MAWQYRIGALKAVPEKLTLSGDNPYLAVHKFIIRSMADILSIYVAPAQRHHAVAEKFGLADEHIVGGGSCYLDKSNRLVLGDSSGQYGSVPGDVALEFVGMVEDELKKMGVKVTGVKADPMVTGVRKYWREQTPPPNQNELVARAQGCLLGQLAGDALGSLVEFKDAAEIKHAYPDGVRDLVVCGTWNTLAGQPTDGQTLGGRRKLLIVRLSLD